MKVSIVAALAVLAAGPALAQDENAPGKTLQFNMGAITGPSYDLSLEAAQTAVAVCKKAGDNVGVGIVDATGGLRVVLGADGALAADSNGARRAALFSVAKKMNGTELVAKLAAYKALADETAKNKDWNPHEGTLLIKKGDDILGAIAVEGHPHNTKQELICAQAGIDKIKGRLK